MTIDKPTDSEYIKFMREGYALNNAEVERILSLGKVKSWASLLVTLEKTLQEHRNKLAQSEDELSRKMSLSIIEQYEKVIIPLVKNAMKTLGIV